MNDTARFHRHLDDSHSAVWQVGKWLLDRGYRVTISPHTKCRTHSEWKEHADDGDLYIDQRVEVKHLSCDFTCREDWPFGADFMVCAKHAYDRAVPKPHVFLILNRDRTHVAIVESRSASAWTVEKRRDKRYDDVEQLFYFAPLGCVKFMKL